MHVRRNYNKWVYFRIESPRTPFQGKEMIVHRNDSGQLNYFGNSIAWCLECSPPHSVIDNLAAAKKLRVPFGSGIFISTETVEELADTFGKDAFLKWFRSYRELCTQSSIFNPICP